MGSAILPKTKTLFEDAIRRRSRGDASIGLTPGEAPDASIRPDTSIGLTPSGAPDASIRPDASISLTPGGAPDASIRPQNIKP